MDLIKTLEDERLTGDAILNGEVPVDLVTESLRAALEENERLRKAVEWAGENSYGLDREDTWKQFCEKLRRKAGVVK